MYGVFWGSFSERGMHMWIKHEAVKILLDLAERRLLTSKLVLLMPTCWGTEHPQTRQRLHFTECRDDIQRTGGNFFAKVDRTLRTGTIFYQPIKTSLCGLPTGPHHLHTCSLGKQEGAIWCHCWCLYVQLTQVRGDCASPNTPSCS